MSKEIRVRINKSELLMLKQLLDNCKPNADLSNWNNERLAVHTFYKKISRGLR